MANPRSWRRSCSSDSHGSLQRETQIDSIRSQSAYSAANWDATGEGRISVGEAKQNAGNATIFQTAVASTNWRAEC